MSKKKIIPVRETMCATCPFREGSKYEHLRDDLAMSALNTGSRICHSTGSNAINRRTGKPHKICRGARDFQIQIFHAIGVIKEPTDAAWAAALEEIKKKKR